MASAWTCDNGDGMPAVTQVINVGNGDSEVYCGQCWATFVLALGDAIRAANPDLAPQVTPVADGPQAGAEDRGEPLPFDGGPDDDEDDDEDESAAVAPVALSDRLAQVAQDMDEAPRKRAPRKAAPRARARGVS